MPIPIRKLTDSLRKFSNTVVHELDFQPKGKDDVRSLYQLAKIVEFFSRTPVTSFISKSIQGYTEDPGEAFKPTRPKRETYAFEASVTDISIPPGDLAEKFCVLTCETEDFGTIQLKFWNNKKEDGYGSDLRASAAIAWKFCTIYVTEVLKDDKGGEDDFFATEKSLVVLEPDYLIDVGNWRIIVRQEAQNHLVYLLNRLSKARSRTK
ncbi:MAG: hypothetical protein IPJ00_19285 [Saprospirales bacterium]|nr:hypothetical protein [Saprospirales bacterium]